MNGEARQLTREELIEQLEMIFSGTLKDHQMAACGKRIEESVPHPDVLSLVYYPNSVKRRSCEEIIDLALSYEPPVVDLPLLEQLWQMSEEVRERFGPQANLAGFAWFPRELYWGGYHNSPTNTVAFASTGGDGGHYNFLMENNRIDANTPVVFTQPDCDGNAIVGESLFDLLCFGMHCGYFYPLDVLEESTGQGGHWLGREVSDENREILAWMAETLNLQPWPEHRQRFEALQNKYLSRLEISEEEE